MMDLVNKWKVIQVICKMSGIDRLTVSVDLIYNFPPHKRDILIYPVNRSYMKVFSDMGIVESIMDLLYNNREKILNKSLKSMIPSSSTRLLPLPVGKDYTIYIKHNKFWGLSFVYEEDN